MICLYRVLKNILIKEKMPIWLTLLLFFFTGIATHWMAPRINQRFEQQRIISNYVIKNLDSFSDLSRTLLSEVTVVSNRLTENGSISLQEKEAVLGAITELQWRSHELDIIFEGTQNLKALKDYKKHLADLRDAIKDAKEPKDVDLIQVRSVYFLSSSKKVMNALVSKAGLKIGVE